MSDWKFINKLIKISDRNKNLKDINRYANKIAHFNHDDPAKDFYRYRDLLQESMDIADDVGLDKESDAIFNSIFNPYERLANTTKNRLAVLDPEAYDKLITAYIKRLHGIE